MLGKLQQSYHLYLAVIDELTKHGGRYNALTNEVTLQIRQQMFEYLAHGFGVGFTHRTTSLSLTHLYKPRYVSYGFVVIGFR